MQWYIHCKLYHITRQLNTLNLVFLLLLLLHYTPQVKLRQCEVFFYVLIRLAFTLHGLYNDEGFDFYST